jgi:Secretion system C-terminal sorting domain
MDYSGLKLFYDTTAVLQDTSEISTLAFWLSNKCDVKLSNYQAAVSWYENIIDSPDSENDSTFAIIDLGYVYTLMEDSSQRQNIACRYPEYKPTSAKSYSVYRDKLLDRLFDDHSATGIKEQLPSKESSISNVNIYPNPSKSDFWLTFVSQKVSNLDINIYDNTGRLVKTFPGQTFLKGENTLHLDFSNLPNGIYNCVIRGTGQQMISKKLIKQ